MTAPPTASSLFTPMHHEGDSPRPELGDRRHCFHKEKHRDLGEIELCCFCRTERKALRPVKGHGKHHEELVDVTNEICDYNNGVGYIQ